MLVNQEAKAAANLLAEQWSTSQVYPNYMDENEVKVFKIIQKKSEKYDPILIENKKKMADTVQELCPNVKITVVVSELPKRWHVEATVKSSKRKDMGNIYPLNKVAIHFMNDGRFIFGFEHGGTINRYITRDVLKMHSLMLRLSKLGFDSYIKKDYRHIVVFTKPQERN